MMTIISVTIMTADRLICTGACNDTKDASYLHLLPAFINIEFSLGFDFRFTIAYSFHSGLS